MKNVIKNPSNFLEELEIEVNKGEIEEVLMFIHQKRAEGVEVRYKQLVDLLKSIDKQNKTGYARFYANIAALDTYEKRYHLDTMSNTEFKKYISKIVADDVLNSTEIEDMVAVTKEENKKPVNLNTINPRAITEEYLMSLRKEDLILLRGKFERTSSFAALDLINKVLSKNN